MTALSKDLHHCRRLVASMRSQVLAPSVKRKALADLVVEVARRHAHPTMGGGDQWTPRWRYQRDKLARCARVIQWCWRRFCRRRRVLERLRMQEKADERQGNNHLHATVLKIQSLFRGYRTRKHAHDKVALLRFLHRPRRVSVLVKFKASRELHRIALAQLAVDLNALQRDQELATRSLTEAKDVVAKIDAVENKPRASTRQTKPTPVLVLINAKLLDGTAVRLDARELVLHWRSELERLDKAAVSLRQARIDLVTRHPVVSAAATLIQAAYRGLRCRRAYRDQRRRRRRALMRLVASCEKCQARMNALMNRRYAQQCATSARAIAGVYRIYRARQTLMSLRRQRAARCISRAFLNMKARESAKQRVQSKRIKRQRNLQARNHADRTRTRRVWAAWRSLLLSSHVRAAQVQLKLIAGRQQWLNSNATCIADWWRGKLRQREAIARAFLPEMSPFVLEMLQAATDSVMREEDECQVVISTHTRAKRVFSRLQESMLAEIWRWRAPHAQVYAFARQNALVLDELPLGELWEWITSNVAGHGDTSRESIDLLPPMTERALLFLAAFSRFYALRSRVERQMELVWARYEAAMAMRDYLSLLLAHDLIDIAKAIDFGWRQRAIAFLRRENQCERLEQQWTSSNNSSIAESGRCQADAMFTSFHCLWSRDLCEKCFSLRLPAPTAAVHTSRECQSCCHRHWERSTASKPLSIANNSHRERADSRVSAAERCDFLVVNAFVHVLAPAGSANRSEVRVDELWTAALAHAQSPVAWLYERQHIATLDDLLRCIASSSRSSLMEEWVSSGTPRAVVATLELFTTVLTDHVELIDQLVK